MKTQLRTRKAILFYGSLFCIGTVIVLILLPSGSVTNIEAPNTPMAAAGHKVNGSAVSNIAEVDCKMLEEQLITDNGYVNHITHIYLKDLNSYFKQFKSDNVAWEQLDMLAELGGISPLNSSIVLPQKSYYDSDYTHIPNATNNPKFISLEAASAKEQHLLGVLISNRNLNIISDQIGRDANHKIYFGKSLFSYTLLYSEEDSISVVNQLYSQDFRPIVSDIANALYRERSYNVLVSMINNVDLRDEVNGEDKNNQILVIFEIAAQRFEHELLELWRSKMGLELFLGYSNDILDNLPMFTGSNIRGAVTTLEFLLDAGFQVQTNLGYRRLLSWVPELWLKNNIHRLNTPIGTLNSEMQPYLDELERMVAEYHLELKNINLRTALVSESVCSSELIELRKALLENTSPSNLNFGHKGGQQKVVMPSHQTLEHVTNLIHVPIEGSLGEFKFDLLNALRNRNWDRALEIVPLFFGTEFERSVLATSMRYAIIYNAPTGFFLFLIDRGTTLPEDSILTLAMLLHRTLISDLVPYGLNIHYVDNRGKNALGNILTSPGREFRREYEMFTFLINEGLSLKPSKRGPDVLNIALANLGTEEQLLGYVPLLITRGAEIEESHRRQLVGIKTSNPNKYDQLVSLVPELQIFN